MNKERKIEIGDRITFKSPTRWADRKATRVVKGFDPHGRPEVAYGGCPYFIVQLHEVISVQKK